MFVVEEWKRTSHNQIISLLQKCDVPTFANLTFVYANGFDSKSEFRSWLSDAVKNCESNGVNTFVNRKPTKTYDFLNL